MNSIGKATKSLRSKKPFGNDKVVDRFWWLSAKVDGGFTRESFFDDKRSDTVRRVQDTKVSSGHESLYTDNFKTMPFGEKGDIIVRNAKGTFLGIR